MYMCIHAYTHIYIYIYIYTSNDNNHDTNKGRAADLLGSLQGQVYRKPGFLRDKQTDVNIRLRRNMLQGVSQKSRLRASWFADSRFAD